VSRSQELHGQVGDDAVTQGDELPETIDEFPAFSPPTPASPSRKLHASSSMLDLRKN
jgi:hypothetical protein